MLQAAVGMLEARLYSEVLSTKRCGKLGHATSKCVSAGKAAIREANKSTTLCCCSMLEGHKS